MKRFWWTLLFLASMLAVGLAWLLGTASGVRQLLHLAEFWLPARLAVSQVQGNLLGTLRLKEVSFASPALQLTLGELVLRWRPGSLLQGRVEVKELSLDRLTYEGGKAAPESGPSAAPLPSLRMPLEVALHRFDLRHARLVSAPGAQPLELEEVSLAAHWGGEELQLQRLYLALAGLRMQASGRLRPQGDYPLKLGIQWQLERADLPRVQGKGQLAGDLARLELEQQVEGDLALHLEASLKGLLARPAWSARLSLHRLPRRHLPEGVPEEVEVTARAGGDLAAAEVHLLAQPGKGKTQGEPGMKLWLGGRVDFSTPAFDLKGDWRQLQWPVAGAAEVVSPRGELSLSGVPDDYRFQLRAEVAGKELPRGSWELAGKGDRRQLVLESLTGETLNGLVTGTGKLAWGERLSWQVRLQANDIDPSVFRPHWPGNLELAVASEGRWHQGKLFLEGVLERLSGQLNGQPVSGSGRFRLSGKALRLEKVMLASGSARLQADGRLEERWDLSWKLEVPDLGTLVPGGEGRIQGAGSIQGSVENPVIQGELLAEELRQGRFSLARVLAHIDLGIDASRKSRVEISGRQLVLSGEEVSRFRLSLEGPPAAQRILFQADHERAKVSLEARGALDVEKRAWQGTLTRMSFQGEKIGKWSLLQPASIALRSNRFELSRLCLEDRPARLCLRVQRQKGGGKAELDLRGLDLARFRPLLPPELVELSGVLEARASAELEQPFTARLAATLSPGELVYQDQQGRRVTLPHHDSRLEAEYGRDRLQAQWRLELGPHSAQGTLSLPRKALDDQPVQAPLDGKVQLTLADLSLLPLFLPGVRQAEGAATTNLVLGGSLQQPKVTGQAELQARKLELPGLGVTYRDAVLSLVGRDGRLLQLQGKVRSGEGVVRLEGTLLLDRAGGWPLAVSLEGERFQLANLPEARVVVDPRLQLQRKGERLSLRGRVEVPRAAITLHDLPAGTVDVSPDVVVIGRDEEERISPVNLDGRVELVLGEAVHFSGFGLDADLEGKVTISLRPHQVPMANGELMVRNGTFRAYGQNLTIDRGRLSWAGGSIDNPLLHLQASRRVDDLVVGLRVSGSLKSPALALFSSDSTLSEKEMAAMLITGHKEGDLSQASIYAGRQITPKLSVGVNLGGGDRGTEFVARYRLMKHLQLEGTSSARKSGASINYTFDLE